MSERRDGPDDPLRPGRVLRRPGLPVPLHGFRGVQIDDARLLSVLAPEAALLVLHEGTLHGEGPVWDPARSCLFWSDVSNRRLLRWHPDGAVTVAIDATAFMNGNALDADGHLVHCEHGRRCISRSVDLDRTVPIISHYEGRRLNSPNDVTVASDGAIWFTDPTFGLLMPSQGSLAEPELDHRSVYRFDPADASLRRMADFEQPNGLAFSPDGRTLYVSDTSDALATIPGPDTGRKHEIERFDVGADGTLGHRRFFCQTDHGVPDGFAVDRRGWVWTTAGDGVHVWSPDGTRLGFIPTPAVCANCAFGGGARGERLFIAASEYLLAIDLRPEAAG